MFCELIEEILPLNYYSEMCGIMADMQLIFKILKSIMPQIYAILDDKEENCGDFIGNNLINQGLNNLFTNDMLNNDTSLLLWDLIFLEGNTILIKSFIAIYSCLSPILLKSKKTIENFKNIINNDLKNIKPDNDELINVLFIKEFNFNENYINEERFKFSSLIAEALENNTIDSIKTKLKISYEKQLDAQIYKTKSCNKNRPYCMNDTYFENVTQIIFYTSLTKQNIGKYDDNYFFEGFLAKKENKKEQQKEKNYYNIPIERRPHLCFQDNEEIIQEKKEEEIIAKNIDINKEKKANDINTLNEKNNNIDNNENKLNKINEENNNNTATTSVKSDSEEVINTEEDLK